MEKNSHYLEWLKQNTEKQLQAKYGDVVGKIVPLDEGSMNLTFLGETGVIHVGEEPIRKDPLIEEAVLPHIYRNKGQAINTVLERIHIPSSKAVTVPHTLFHDSISVDKHPFSVWADEKISNVTETRIDERGYSELIDWVVGLQQGNRHSKQTNLTDYYQRRLALFDYALGASAQLNDVPSRDILLLMQDCVQMSVSPDEKTGFVHGDLNRSNLLTYQENSKNKVAVIDFEKSPFPGDSLVDPLKLLKLKRLYLPARQGTEDEELTDKQRIRLMNRYLKNSDKPSFNVEQLMLRDALVNLDTIMSVYIARVNQPSLLSKGASVEVLESYAATYYKHATSLFT